MSDITHTDESAEKTVNSTETDEDAKPSQPGDDRSQTVDDTSRSADDASPSHDDNSPSLVDGHADDMTVDSQEDTTPVASDALAEGPDFAPLQNTGNASHPMIDKTITDPVHFPDNPNYWQPLPEHGAMPADPPMDGPATDNAQSLVTDKDPPYGRSDYGHGDPFTKEENEERFIDPNGQNVYAPNGGAVPDSYVWWDSHPAYLTQYGPYVDRIGDESGSYMAVAPDGVPMSFEARGLNNTSLGQEFHQYQFTGDLPDGWHIETSTVRPAAGRPGGATQVQVFNEDGKVVSIAKQLSRGVLVPR